MEGILLKRRELLVPEDFVDDEGDEE